MDDGHVQCSCCHKKSLEEYREKNLKHLNETFSKDLEKSSAEKKKFIDICHKCIKDTSAPIEDPMQCTNISCEVYYDRTAPIMKTEILEKMCKTVPMLDKYENWESNHLDQTYSYCLDRDEKLKKSAFNKMLTLQRKESPVQTSCKHCREDTDNLVKHLLTQCEDPHVKHKRLKRDEKVSSMLRKYLHRKDIELVWERDMKDTKHSIVNTSQPLVFGVRGGLLGGVYANSIKKKITLDKWKAIVKYLVLKNRDILNYT